MTAILIFGLAGMARAETVQLDLLNLGCPTELNIDTPYWQTNFDLGVTFTEISHVYMDWSGQIMAGLYSDPAQQPQPFPLNAGIYAAMGRPFTWRYTTTVSGGEATYPAAEPFGQISEFIHGNMPWSTLFDGQGDVTVQYDEPVAGSSGGQWLTHGSITLEKAILVVEGTVPEPASILLLAAGLTFVRHKRRVNDSTR